MSSYVECTVKMLSEMESIFSFKAANLNQDIGRRNWFIQKRGGRGKGRDCLGIDLALGTQVDTRVGDITVVTISGGIFIL